jgi:hypothetical protein
MLVPSVRNSDNGNVSRDLTRYSFKIRERNKYFLLHQLLTLNKGSRRGLGIYYFLKTIDYLSPRTQKRSALHGTAWQIEMKMSKISGPFQV